MVSTALTHHEGRGGTESRLQARSGRSENHGAVAQSGEHLDRTQEVAGSNPAGSIPRYVRGAVK